MGGEGWDGAAFMLPGPGSARAAGAREDRSKGLQANTGLPEDLNSVEKPLENFVISGEGEG